MKVVFNRVRDETEEAKWLEKTAQEIGEFLHKKGLDEKAAFRKFTKSNKKAVSYMEFEGIVQGKSLTLYKLHSRNSDLISPMNRLWLWRSMLTQMVQKISVEENSEKHSGLWMRKRDLHVI